MKRLALAASLAALSLAASAHPAAAASVTIGRLAPAPSVSCAGSTFDFIEPTVNSGPGYVVPSIPSVSALMISSWSHNGAPAAGTLTAVGPLTLKVFRKVANPATYQVVGHDTRDLIPATLNTFQVRLPVQTGDVIGTNTAQPATTACTFSDPGQTHLLRAGNLADGESGVFAPGSADRSVNVSAVISPSNLFTVGAIKRNKKKGTAKLTVDVPNPGDLIASGNGVNAASAAEARISKSVAAGQAQLVIKAKGKKKKKLNKKGKVKLDVAVTYTPTGGDPSTQSTKVKLRKKL